MYIERQFVEVKQRQIVIELPEAFVDHWVEVIALTVDEEKLNRPQRRRPHAAIAGKGRTVSDLISPVVDDADWVCLQ